MKKISILGCCVSRDSCSELNVSEFAVERYNAFVSPMSLYLKREIKNNSVITEEKEKLINEGKKVSSFLLRCVINDINSNVINYIFDDEHKSDFYLVDIADVRMDLMVYGECTVTKSNSALQRKTEMEGIFNHKLEKILSATKDFTEEQWFECIKWYVQQILFHVPKERIIFHKISKVDIFFDESEKVLKLYDYERALLNQKKFIDKINDYMELLLDGCHVIKMPENNFGKMPHHWGKHPLHYCDEYYEYAAKAITIISEGHFKKEEDALLNKLYDEYNAKLGELRKRYFHNTVKELNNKIRQYDMMLKNFSGGVATETSLKKYLELLCRDRTRFIVLLCVKDTPGKRINSEAWKSLGISSDINNHLHYTLTAIIDEGNITYEHMGLPKEENHLETYCNGMHIEMDSKSYVNGNLASIKLDGMEYAVNKRGLNIVVYDKKIDRVIDSVVFDTHGAKDGCYR